MIYENFAGYKRSIAGSASMYLTAILDYFFYKMVNLASLQELKKIHNLINIISYMIWIGIYKA